VLVVVGYRQLLAPVLTVSQVTDKTVTSVYRPPGNSAAGHVIVYRLQYRRVNSGAWNSLPGTSSSSQTVTGLTADTEYQLRLGARHRRPAQLHSWGMPSDPVTVRTRRTPSPSAPVRPNQSNVAKGKIALLVCVCQVAA